MDIPSKKENIEALIKTVRELVPERDLEKLLERVLAVSTQILGAERALLFLFDRKTDVLIFKYGVNIEGGSSKRPTSAARVIFFSTRWG